MAAAAADVVAVVRVPASNVRALLGSVLPPSPRLIHMHTCAHHLCVSRYYINLVPYQLIKRSKFVYHYIPALLHGVMLLVVVCDIALKWATLAQRRRQGSGVSVTLAARLAVAAVLV